MRENINFSPVFSSAYFFSSAPPLSTGAAIFRKKSRNDITHRSD
jgi:hypothetical protein